MRLCARHILSCAKDISSADKISLHQKIENSLMQLGPDGVCRSANAMEKVLRNLDLDVELVRGIPISNAPWNMAAAE